MSLFARHTKPCQKDMDAFLAELRTLRNDLEALSRDEKQTIRSTETLREPIIKLLSRCKSISQHTGTQNGWMERNMSWAFHSDRNTQDGLRLTIDLARSVLSLALQTGIIQTNLEFPMDMVPPYSSTDERSLFSSRSQRRLYRARLLCHFDYMHKDKDSNGHWMKVVFPPFIDEDVYPFRSRFPGHELKCSFWKFPEENVAGLKRNFIAQIGHLDAFKSQNLSEDCFELICRNQIITKPGKTVPMGALRLSLLMLPIYASEYITTGYDYAYSSGEGKSDEMITVEADEVQWKMPKRFRKEEPVEETEVLAKGYRAADDDDTKKMENFSIIASEDVPGTEPEKTNDE